MAYNVYFLRDHIYWNDAAPRFIAFSAQWTIRYRDGWDVFPFRRKVGKERWIDRS